MSNSINYYIELVIKFHVKRIFLSHKLRILRIMFPYKFRINSCNPKATQYELGLGLFFEASGFIILLNKNLFILLFDNKNQMIKKLKYKYIEKN